MTSDDLGALADRIGGHAFRRTAPSPEECAAMCAELLKIAQMVAVMETLPFETTLRLLEAVPEWPLLRTALDAPGP